MSPLGDRFARSLRPTDFVAPLFVLACLLMGGATREGQGMHMVLSFAALGILGWLWLAPQTKPLSPPARSLRLIVLIALIVALLQLVPLPPALWSPLPGREPVARAFALIGQALPWLPLSLTPELTLRAIAAVLPAVAVAGLTLTGSRRSVQLSLAVIIVVALFSVAFGFFQLSADFYLYDRTNRGQPTAFFANSNHLATLLIVTLPVVAMVITRTGASAEGSQRLVALRVLMAGAGVLLLAGLATNGSRAGVLLALPIVAASVALFWLGRQRTLPRLWAWLAIAGAGVAAIGLLVASSTDLLTAPDLANRITSRSVILATTIETAMAHMPMGSGLGSFPVVYPGFEAADQVGRTFVNHVHNDYAELLIEAGLPGLLVMVLLLVWWVRRTVAIWTAIEPGTLMARLGTIGSAAILLHSVVDYPARSIAIMILLAMFLALMAEPVLHTGARASARAPAKARHRSV